MSTATATQDHAVVARKAAIRAEAIRHQLARTSDSLEPLRAAWRRRAAELELAATVLWPDAPVEPAFPRSA